MDRTRPAGREGWADWRRSLALVHHDPQADAARKRLAYDEVFANQLALLLLCVSRSGGIAPRPWRVRAS